jgi:orotate phosphoribosyltransferase
MTREELAKEIYSVSHITGEFLLRSGQISNEYFDKYKFESDPKLLDNIGEHMKGLIPKDTDILAGLEMGGIPLAVILSHKTGLPAVFVRKKAKEYGTRKLAEGKDFDNKKLTIIEDVVTTGGQIVKSANELRNLGAVVNDVLCAILRDNKAFENLGTADLNLSPLFNMEELKKSESS